MRKIITFYAHPLYFVVCAYVGVSYAHHKVGPSFICIASIMANTFKVTHLTVIALSNQLKSRFLFSE